MNIANLATVGESTDGWGIVGEIKKRCQDDPSTNLMSVASKLYTEMAAAKR